LHDQLTPVTAALAIAFNLDARGDRDSDADRKK
jgi:hypothetical protein